MNSNTEKFLKEIGVTSDAIDQLKGEDDIEGQRPVRWL